MNKEEIKKIINGEIPFKGNFLIEADMLYKLFDDREDFHKLSKKLEKIYSKVRDVFGDITIKTFMTLVISSNENQRIIKFNIEPLIKKIFYEFGVPDYFNYMELDNKSVAEHAQKILREKIKQIDNTKNYEELEKVVPGLKETLSPELKQEDKIIYFNSLKNDLKNRTMKRSVWIKKILVEELNQPLDYDVLEGINSQKFNLYMAKEYFEQAKNLSLIEGKMINCLLHLMQVKKILDTADENFVFYGMSYHKYIMKNVQIYEYFEEYSYRDLRNEFNEFLEKNPEIKKQLDELLKYNKEDFNNMTIEEIAEYTTLILEEAKENWQTVNKNQIQLEIDELIKTSKTVSPEEKGNILLLSKKISILLKNKPLRVIKGIDTFTGSYGFIYSNGKIVLETLYEDEAKKKISNGKASYVMDIEKFKEYAKLKRKELMGKEDVDRVVHRGDWEEKFIKLIIQNQESTSNALSELEFIDANIDSIINVDELDKCLKKLDELEQTLPKQEIEKEVKKIKKKKKKLVLGKLEKELHDNPSSDYTMMQDKEDASVTEEKLLKKIGADNFIDFMEKYYKLLDGNIELKEKRKKLKRNPAIAAYTKHRANCTCDLCGEKYAEESIFDAHHLIPLKDGGPDNIYNTVCLCPNCHRIAHTTGFRDNEMYLLMDKIKTYLEKEDLTEEYMHNFYETFKYYLQMYIEEDWFMEWNQHKR